MFFPDGSGAVPGARAVRTLGAGQARGRCTPPWKAAAVAPPAARDRTQVIRQAALSNQSSVRAMHRNSTQWQPVRRSRTMNSSREVSCLVLTRPSHSSKTTAFPENGTGRTAATCSLKCHSAISKGKRNKKKCRKKITKTKQP